MPHSLHSFMTSDWQSEEFRFLDVICLAEDWHDTEGQSLIVPGRVYSTREPVVFESSLSLCSAYFALSNVYTHTPLYSHNLLAQNEWYGKHIIIQASANTTLSTQRKTSSLHHSAMYHVVHCESVPSLERNKKFIHISGWNNFFKFHLFHTQIFQ